MDASGILSQYGLPGLVIFVLSAVNAMQYRDNKALQDKLIESQQARVDDAKEVNAKNAEASRVQGQVMDLVYGKLVSAKKES